MESESRPGKGNDQEMVEGLVGYARRNFLAPVQRSASWEELNAHLGVEQAFGCRHLNCDRPRKATLAWATMVRESRLYRLFPVDEPPPGVIYARLTYSTFCPLDGRNCT